MLDHDIPRVNKTAADAYVKKNRNDGGLENNGVVKGCASWMTGARDLKGIFVRTQCWSQSDLWKSDGDEDEDEEESKETKKPVEHDDLNSPIMSDEEALKLFLESD